MRIVKVVPQDESTIIIISLKKLKSIYHKGLNTKFIPSFIQFTSLDPLTVALWSEKNIERFHKMSKTHSLVLDATGSVTIKLNDKEAFYFPFLSFDRSLKAVPVSHLEILTDRATSNTLQFILGASFENEMTRDGYTTSNVPFLCILSEYILLSLGSHRKIRKIRKIRARQNHSHWLAKISAFRAFYQ